MTNMLKEYVPLKQGLRPEPAPSCCIVEVTQRVCSIKTRIKTSSSGITMYSSKMLKEYVPLKQGLRQFLFPNFDELPKSSKSMFH